ncbi:hypothetical protein [Amycolatopsis sp.]|uniref:hypothetical protein n=1 Tax=Amycolatopsis sp. TaxID=37632 RepID=UPI002B970AAA|nr:hypothetical protein [Amycolatopsis sp.]HVV11588.1 hypothetical protein [Amycolatopsis sp.]
MARSKRARRRGSSVPALVEALPDTFLAPALGSDPTGALRDYTFGLRQWVIEQGVAVADANHVVVDVMEHIGADPAEWYRRACSS